MKTAILAFIVFCTTSLGVAIGYSVKSTPDTLPRGIVPPETRAYLTKEGCVSLGMPTDPEALKFLGEGFLCKGTLVVTIK